MLTVSLFAVRIACGVVRIACGVVPTELTEKHRSLTGLSFPNPQNGLRFARQESTEMKGIFRMIKGIYSRRYSSETVTPTICNL